MMVRRLKEDIRRLDGGFPERIVTQVDIEGPPERELVQKLGLDPALAVVRAGDPAGASTISIPPSSLTA